jgi:hypothetical protein
VTGTSTWSPLGNGLVVYGQVFTFNEDPASSEDTYQYTLQVAVQSRLVTTQPINEDWNTFYNC